MRPQFTPDVTGEPGVPAPRNPAPGRGSRRRAAPAKASLRTRGRSRSRDHGLLPQPPDDTEKYAYARRHLWVLTFGSLLSFAALAASQFLFTKSSPWFWLALPPLALVTADYLISLYLDGFSKDFDIKAHRRLVSRWRPEVKPSVDVFLPVCVLDDAADPEVEAMARHFGFAYVVRPNRGWFKKAGNLHHAFGLTHGEHILILDADFAHRPSDVLAWRTPREQGSFDAAECPQPQSCLAGTERLWLVSTSPDRAKPFTGMAEASAALIQKGFRVVRTEKLDSVRVLLLERAAEAAKHRENDAATRKVHT